MAVSGQQMFTKEECFDFLSDLLPRVDEILIKCKQRKCEEVEQILEGLVELLEAVGFLHSTIHRRVFREFADRFKKANFFF